MDAAARGLAGLLAGAFLVFGLLATDGPFHQAFHSAGKTASSNCLLCLFAKGQVDLAESVPDLSPPVRRAFDPPRQIEPIVLPSFTYLASLGRAPPESGALLAVVA